jgi:mRNA interferase MazF
VKDLYPGDIVLVDLEPSVAGEQGGVRPALVVSGLEFNRWPVGLTVIVPVTSRHKGFDHHVPVGHDGGLKRESWAMPEYVRSVTQHRVGRVIAQADDWTIAEVQRWVARFLLLDGTPGRQP